MYDLKHDKYLYYNFDRVHTPFIPASTYKILHALIALETGVIQDEDEIIKWDGVDRGSEGWNRDHNMIFESANDYVKKPGMTDADFFHYWKEVHGPIGAKIPGLKRLVQSHAVAAGSKTRAGDYDGMAELCLKK